MTFLELGLAEPIVRAVAHEGYTTPTPIQAQAIPHALKGHDLFGCAQTGTGKTGAFAMPILHRLAASVTPGTATGENPQASARKRGPRALVLCPTRELASQILASFVAYGRHLPLRHDAIFGGVGQGPQVRSIRAGLDVLVATPGRLLDLIEQRHLDLKHVEILVLDEADRMLDMGFIDPIRRVIKMIPTERQTLFFSATVSPDIRKLADSILRSPTHLSVARESTVGQDVLQRVYLVERRLKPQLLHHVLKQEGVGRTLVFTRTKHGADKLVQMLRRAGSRAEAIHGNKSQNARTRALRDFRDGRVPVLVATDIASRGIDVDMITHVVNFDMPIDAETHVHRIGRTARAGATGTAISLCDRDEVGVLRSIERRTRATMEIIKDLPALAPLPSFSPAAATEPPDAREERTDMPPTHASNRRAPFKPRASKVFGGGDAMERRGPRPMHPREGTRPSRTPGESHAKPHASSAKPHTPHSPYANKPHSGKPPSHAGPARGGERSVHQGSWRDGGRGMSGAARGARPAPRRAR
jgi:ATP-dependent RNA helicase RhlE